MKMENILYCDNAVCQSPSFRPINKMQLIYFTITWVVSNVLRAHDACIPHHMAWAICATSLHSTSYGLGNIGSVTLYIFMPYCLYKYKCVYSIVQHSPRNIYDVYFIF